MRGERAILLDVFFCPNEWLFVWLLHALIHDIMRSSHDVIHQSCLVAIKRCFTWFFLSSFHMPWSHGVTFLGTSAPLMIVIVMLFFQILLTVHRSIVRPPWKESLKIELRWRQLWWTAERLCFAKEERDSRDREGSKLDNGMVLLETQHGNHLGQGYIVSSGIHSFCSLFTLGWTQALFLSIKAKSFWRNGTHLFRPGPGPAVRGKTWRGADAVCWRGAAAPVVEVVEAAPRWSWEGAARGPCPRGWRPGSRLLEKWSMYYFPLCVMPGHNISSFSLFHRSIAEGKEGEEGEGRVIIK